MCYLTPYSFLCFPHPHSSPLSSSRNQPFRHSLFSCYCTARLAIRRLLLLGGSLAHWCLLFRPLLCPVDSKWDRLFLAFCVRILHHLVFRAFILWDRVLASSLQTFVSPRLPHFVSLCQLIYQVFYSFRRSVLSPFSDIHSRYTFRRFDHHLERIFRRQINTNSCISLRGSLGRLFPHICIIRIILDLALVFFWI